MRMENWWEGWRTGGKDGRKVCLGGEGREGEGGWEKGGREKGEGEERTDHQRVLPVVGE